jgi:hypothetical protein
MKSTQEALAKPPGSKMYAFGTVALHQFVGNIHLWPQFCARVLQVRPLPIIGCVQAIVPIKHISYFPELKR